eukprot:CAMPEP_0185511230 /NCGR_PEP_ID=MMETSP1366-20130426/51158_1 /TAXON_ID=38817 /ORGANISM="Gephyrocapsa oceanica, Strain RCC1303" /LENGTH=74 /DNA_ID=CAMNT_0028121785 /DNA_START=359 /DNA_END=579 /DNA_ORIENTATION=-
MAAVVAGAAAAAGGGGGGALVLGNDAALPRRTRYSAAALSAGSSPGLIRTMNLSAVGGLTLSTPESYSSHAMSS